LTQQHEVAARVHSRLAPDGLLMVRVADVVDFEALNLRALAAQRVSGAEYYKPPAPVVELFEPGRPRWWVVSTALAETPPLGRDLLPAGQVEPHLAGLTSGQSGHCERCSRTDW
jgi:hypothetical protein